MHKPHYKFVLTLLLVLWTAGVLYGSLAPGDDLPPAGWLAMIPYFDKVVHFGFYFGETLLVLLLFEPRGWRRWTAVAAVILCSGAVELVQGALGYRSKDFWDFVANSSGALVAVAVAPLLQRFVKRSLR
ncbi:VanZ family protein [Alistipes indistinctus]|jgi:vanZ family protein|uniref:VanZ-like domain-containing protein n=1 Tax=Alistipes indistinctus YIT 12060 TaxID=742725 RepID=G5H5K0_9BACT|nr:VanZ family protein [Alistipes indistinctus]MBS1440550.1 VanZ family protein [Alistipes sp.]EHB93439.1 hypothetical protein HMPREF9450_00210 [Alistipes indistinctus YIT 12060]MBD9134349.1 VanZ family protein [Alistipes indistinctus]MBD9134435.1 VanZ family protein [Alistipes indistinctus]UWN58959.1 VanZ family protein [Alistipes indistinctus YIT 12060]